MSEPKEQRTKGAKELIELLLFDLSEIGRYLDTAQKNIRANPGLCADYIDRAHRQRRVMEDRIREKVDPLLKRRAARDAEADEIRELRDTLKRAIDALTDDTPSNVTRLKREG